MHLDRSTDLRHFLDASGAISEELPPRARGLVEYLGKMVASVSANREFYSTDEFHCRRSVAKKKCRGRVAAWLMPAERPEGEITWYCEVCGYGGVISGWTGTVFDRSKTRKKRELEYEQQGIWVGGERLDEVKIPLNVKRTSFRQFLRNQDIRVSGLDSGGVRLVLPAMLAVELFVRGSLRETGQPISLRIGTGPDRKYELRTVTYDSGNDARVEILFVPFGGG